MYIQVCHATSSLLLVRPLLPLLLASGSSNVKSITPPSFGPGLAPLLLLGGVSQILAFLLGFILGLLSLGLGSACELVGGTDSAASLGSCDLSLGLDLLALLVADVCGRLVREELRDQYNFTCYDSTLQLTASSTPMCSRYSPRRPYLTTPPGRA